MRLSRLDLLLAGSAAALGVAGTAIWLSARRRTDPAAAERKRRQRVASIGRITLGEFLDLVETAAEIPPSAKRAKSLLIAEKPAPRRLAIYRYSIAGVAYETAQDISDLWNEATAAKPGQMVRVKYDPAHPSNSILAAENWPGLNSPASVRAGAKGK